MGFRVAVVGAIHTDHLTSVCDVVVESSCVGWLKMTNKTFVAKPLDHQMNMNVVQKRLRLRAVLLYDLQMIKHYEIAKHNFINITNATSPLTNAHNSHYRLYLNAFCTRWKHKLLTHAKLFQIINMIQFMFAHPYSWIYGHVIYKTFKVKHSPSHVVFHAAITNHWISRFSFSVQILWVLDQTM